MRPIYKGLLLMAAIVIPLALLVGGAIWWYNANLQPFNPADTAAIKFRVEDGASSEEVARKLEKNDLIRNQLAFRVYLRLHGVSDQLQAGLYEVNTAMSVPQITRKIVSGETAARILTINSGMRLAQITDRLRQQHYPEAEIAAALADSYDYSILKDKPPEASLEGYLFPETYIVDLDTSAVRLIDLILSTTDSRITPEIRQGWAGRGLNLHQGLTLASIVQKEVAKPEDQQQVAQVFLKRLSMGMKLEADPTFEYGAALLGAAPTPEVDSPYNTYLHPGLTPTPIAAVDTSAMQAVANPAATNFLYFVSDKAGNTHFSEDLEKHKQNIEEYLR